MIIPFCLGACIGMIYTFLCYEIIRRKQEKQKESESLFRATFQHLKSWLYSNPKAQKKRQ